MFKGYVKPTLILTVITVTVAVLLAFTHSLTSGKLNQNNTDEKYLEANLGIYNSVLPSAEDFILISREDIGTNEGVFMVAEGRTGDVKCGYVITANGKGYSSVPIQMVVGISLDGLIQGVEVLSLSETPGIGDGIKDRTFLDKFIDSDFNYFKDGNVQDKVDAVTGATYSSKGVFKAIESALEKYEEMR